MIKLYNFWYKMIFSYNGYRVIRNGKPYHVGWKGKLNQFCHWSGITYIGCKLKGYKTRPFKERTR